MFNDLRRELGDLEGTNQIPVSIQSDDDGYFDRQCHAEDCMFEFKVQEEDWLAKIQGRVVCPFCGHSAEPVDWNTHEQTEYFMEVASSHIGRRLGLAMRRDATRWNRRQPRGGLLTVTMRVEGRPMSVPLPPSAADPMRLKVRCSQCECRYAVIGAAFFCPGCGHNDAEVLFNLTMSGIRQLLCAVNEIRIAISDADTSENAVRALVEHGLQSAVTAFQRYAEALYSRLVTDSKPKRNIFQNLTKGSNLWYDAAGRHYSEYLSTAEMTELKRAFQQRHLLAHTQGIVDQDYINLSGDTSHRLGQRVVIRETTVHKFLDVNEKLAAGLLEATNDNLARAADTDLQVSNIS